MSQNIKIGDKTYNGVKYISCACADHEGEQRRFIDEMSLPENKLAKLVNGWVDIALTAEDLAGCTRISDYAFYECRKLVSIVIPDSVTSIGKNAFYECIGLENIEIPNSVTSIKEYAFSHCYGSSLTSIVIPNSVTSIENGAFSTCFHLTNMVIPDGITSINPSTFYSCSELSNIVIPDSVTSIGKHAFRSCSGLTSIVIPDGVTSIGYEALKIGSTTNKATITFKRTTPPTISSDTFDATMLAKIIVPAGCGDAYKAATNWAAFADYIEEATA